MLHTSDPSSIPGILNGPLNTTRSNPSAQNQGRPLGITRSPISSAPQKRELYAWNNLKGDGQRVRLLRGKLETVGIFREKCLELG